MSTEQGSGGTLDVVVSSPSGNAQNTVVSDLEKEKTSNTLNLTPLKLIGILLLAFGLGCLISNIDRMIDDNDDSDSTNCDNNSASNSNSNTDDSDSSLSSLDKEIDRLCIYRAVGGCSVSVYYQSELVYDYGSGYVDIDDISSTRMRIASITKPFTSAALSLIKDNNDDYYIKNISWNSTIYDILKYNETILNVFMRFSTLSEYIDVITINDLISHRSGIRHYATAYEFTWHWDYADKSKNASYYNENNLYDLDLLYNYLSLFGNDSLVFEPNTGYKYSSFGIYILNVLIYVITEQTFYNFIENNIIDPLSLNNTGTMLDFLPNLHNKTKTQYTRQCEQYDTDYALRAICDLNDTYSSYYYDNSVFQKQTAGGLISTTKDLVTFGETIRTNKMNGEQFLSDESYNATFYGYSEISSTDYYGHGWHFDKQTNPNTIWHTGGAIAGVGYLKIIKNESFVVAVLCDTAYRGGIIYDIADAVHDYFVG